jgi:transposase
MLQNDRSRPETVIGPLGEALDKDSLPPRNTSRWVARRKAEVVAAVKGGLLTIAEACERYDLSLEELASWQRAVEREGMAGLRATRVQHYRQIHERQARKA